MSILSSRQRSEQRCSPHLLICTQRELLAFGKYFFIVKAFLLRHIDLFHEYIYYHTFMIFPFLYILVLGPFIARCYSLFTISTQAKGLPTSNTGPSEEEGFSDSYPYLQRRVALQFLSGCGRAGMKLSESTQLGLLQDAVPKYHI